MTAAQRTCLTDLAALTMQMLTDRRDRLRWNGVIQKSVQQTAHGALQPLTGLQMSLGILSQQQQDDDDEEEATSWTTAQQDALAQAVVQANVVAKLVQEAIVPLRQLVGRQTPPHITPAAASVGDSWQDVVVDDMVTFTALVQHVREVRCFQPSFHSFIDLVMARVVLSHLLLLLLLLLLHNSYNTGSPCLTTATKVLTRTAISIGHPRTRITSKCGSPVSRTLVPTTHDAPGAHPTHNVTIRCGTSRHDGKPRSHVSVCFDGCGEP